MVWSVNTSPFRAPPPNNGLANFPRPLGLLSPDARQ
jgi:hypothetical protein